MEDLIDQLRDQRLRQTVPAPSPTTIGIVRPQTTRSEYSRLHTRLRAGLVGSIVLMLAVACLMPLYVHRTSYMVCYIVVQLITIVRVLIAIQINLPLRHIHPSRSVRRGLSPWNIRAAAVSPFSCQSSQASAVMLNSPPWF